MPDYKVNKDAVDKAKKLINDGHVDTETDWSDAAPSTDEENSFIDKEGYDGYGQWHLGIEKSASEQTKGRFGFPYGDFTKLNRAGLIHAKQRASQNDHDDIAKAADELLQRIDDRSS